MEKAIPCVLMRAGTSRGPFFLREWLPADDDEARDQALIGAIGASDPLQLDGVGGGSTLNSKVAIVSRSTQPGCDLDYLFAQVGVGHRSVDTRPNCGNMLSGVAPFAIEQGLITGCEGTTRVRVFNVNTGSRIDVTVRTPGGRVTYEGDARIDGVAGTAAPILLDFLDAWGAVTGKVFPDGPADRHHRRHRGDLHRCGDAVDDRAGCRSRSDRPRKAGRLSMRTPVLLERLEALRLEAGLMMGLGDVSNSVIPKPVLVSAGDSPDSITSRYFTPRRCHASHAVTGAIGVASAFALPAYGGERCAARSGHSRPGRAASGRADRRRGRGRGRRRECRASPAPRSCGRHARSSQGELHLPDYVFSRCQVASSRSTVDRADARRRWQRHDGTDHRGPARAAPRPRGPGRQSRRRQRRDCLRVSSPVPRPTAPSCCSATSAPMR